MNSPPSAASAELIADKLLAERVGTGDRSAFEMLMRRYNRRLYRLARSVLREKAEAEDALQETYLAAFRSIDQYRGTAALETWLSKLLLNECYARLRRESRRNNILPIISAGLNMDDRIDDGASGERPEQLVAQEQMRSILERKVDLLPDLFRVVFVMRSFEDLSVEEIAQILSVPPETVRSRHFRARAMLREALAKDIDLAEGNIYEFGGSGCDAVVTAVLTNLQRQ